jgi:hypothetical protein
LRRAGKDEAKSYKGGINLEYTKVTIFRKLKDTGRQKKEADSEAAAAVTAVRDVGVPSLELWRSLGQVSTVLGRLSKSKTETGYEACQWRTG